MADVKKNCSKCGKKNVKVTKKGFDTTGRQRWLCSSCRKTFVVPGSKIVRSTKKTATKVNISSSIKKKNVKAKKTVTTNIFVNNNVIKEVNKDITEDQAFDMVSTYFREITKTDVSTTKDKDGNKSIKFAIKTGTKG